jgi:hypothetical protein
MTGARKSQSAGRWRQASHVQACKSQIHGAVQPSIRQKNKKEGKDMSPLRTKRLFLILVVSITAGVFTVSLPGCDNPRERARDTQRTDPGKEQVTQSREQLQEKKSDLRGAVKEGQSPEEIEQLQKDIKRKKEDIVQDKKTAREKQLNQ